MSDSLRDIFKFNGNIVSDQSIGLSVSYFQCHGLPTLLVAQLIRYLSFMSRYLWRISLHSRLQLHAIIPVLMHRARANSRDYVCSDAIHVQLDVINSVLTHQVHSFT